MSNDIFVDSSVLVEWSKGTKPDLLNHLLSNKSSYELHINDIVLSEYLFYLLIIEGEKAPVTLKRDKAIPKIMDRIMPADFLTSFNVLPNDNRITITFLRLMQRYNLLPNDALILATCLNHGIKTIASFDTDFIEVCQNEGIVLVSEIEQLILITPTQKS